MTETKKMLRLASMAADESRKSSLNYKHGAIIFQGKKKICAGYNMNSRTTYRKNICCSIHAEMDTVTRFLNSFLKIHTLAGSKPDKIRRKMNKFSICVVRSSMGNDGIINLMNSLPCRDCLNKLHTVGLNKVIFSDHDNTICSAKINQLKNNQHSVKWCGVMKIPNVIDKLRVVPLIQYGSHKKTRHC